MGIFGNHFSSSNEELEQGTNDSHMTAQLNEAKMEGTHRRDQNPNMKMETDSKCQGLFPTKTAIRSISKGSTTSISKEPLSTDEMQLGGPMGQAQEVNQTK